jgi:glycosyltransferase involved in cell wall biosynthesis
VGGALVFGTVADRGTMPTVRALAAELRRHHPDARPLQVLLAGPCGDIADEPGGTLAVTLLADLPGLPDAVRTALCAALPPAGLPTALRPHWLARLLETAPPGARAVLLDPSLRPNAALHAAAGRADVVAGGTLVPGPGSDDAEAPAYNVEFLALRAGSADAARLLDWWRDRVAEAAGKPPAGGMGSGIACPDQRWLDLLPALCPGAVLLEPGDPDRTWTLDGSPPPAEASAAGANSVLPPTAPPFVPARRRPAGINLSGYFRSEKGLGEAVRGTAAALRAAGVPHALVDWHDPVSVNTDVSIDGVGDANPYAVNVVTAGTDQVLLTAIAGKGVEWCAGRYTVGYCHWELPEVPAGWRDGFEYFDELWAPSRFTVEALLRGCPVPVRWVPLVVTAPPPPPADAAGLPDRASLGLPADAFVFLTAFDFQSMIERKNPVGTIRAFRRAFGDRRDVRLLLKTVHSDYDPAAAAEVRAACAGAANIVVFDRILSRPGMHALLRLADAYVALHRAEGYGLPLAEAMAAGKPAVATGYSGNLDFMTPDNSLLVRWRPGRIERTVGPYPAGGVWAEPDVEHGAEQMARLAGDRGLADRLGRRAAEDIARDLNPERVGRIIRARLASLLSAPPLAERSPNRPLGRMLLARARAVRDPSDADMGSHRGMIIGRALAFLRKHFAGLLRPLFARQARCNSATADAIADLIRRVEDQQRLLDEQRRELARLREELRR